MHKDQIMKQRSQTGIRFLKNNTKRQQDSSFFNKVKENNRKQPVNEKFLSSHAVLQVPKVSVTNFKCRTT